MPNLILLTPKHLVENSSESWALAISDRTILLTGVEAKKHIQSNKKILNTVFESVFYFENYLDSDLIDKEILQLCKNKKIDAIITLS